MRHCLIKVQPSEEAKQYSILFLDSLKTKLKKVSCFQIGKQYSEDPGSKNNGGELGWVKEDH